MILVTGATGFVGRRILALCPDTRPCPSLRGADAEAFRRMVAESGADAIIHTAAISDIGACEADPEASWRANVQLPLWLAEAAEGRKLVCFSSDQVYSGCEAEGPYREDTVRPANVYAAHKLEMEQRVLDRCPEAVMLRAEWMYDYHSPRSNYFLNLLGAKERVAFSARQYRGITYLREVAENMPRVLGLPGGAYNFGSETDASMYDITRDFVAFLGLDLRVEDAPPRHSLWMDCGKARALGIRFSSVPEGLRRCARDWRAECAAQEGSCP